MVKMRNILIVFMLVVFSACKSDKMPVDNESVVDKDSLSDIDNIQTDRDISFSDFDTVDRDNETSDIDMDTDSVVCLDLKLQENVIKTNFPFKDKDGKPTFCRPGCDTPTETDPQCVRNIWEWDNWEKYQKYLKAQKKDPTQTTIRECYPWPCKLPDMKANSTLESFNSKCDRWLTVNGFIANEGTIWSHGMSDGVAGMDFASSGRAIEYDPEKDEYYNIGHNLSMGFNEGRYVVEVYDQMPEPSNYTNKQFVVSILRQNGEYFYEIIYDNKSHNSWLSRPAFSGRNWAMIQVKEGKAGTKTEFKYASSKDWQWHNIEGIQNYTGEGNIAGDHLTFITNDREIYYCDLTKYPKHINDCKKINRLNSDGKTYELGHSPRIDTENEYRMVYNIHGQNIFVEVNLNDVNNPKYTEYEIPKYKENAQFWGPSKLQGNRVIYIESDSYDDIGCFYRFDKKKSYCPQEKIFSTSPDSLMGYNTFWGKWHLWKIITSPVAIMRDWECYCEETGVCPFEE